MSAQRKPENFPIQLIGLSMIVVDHAIQPRVATNIEYQREFSEAMLRGDQFPPVTLFFDGKTYWLADGFHRYGAFKMCSRADPARFANIRAEVRPGSRNDAIVFSAGANQKFSIPRTRSDVRKAIEMLLHFKIWRERSDSWIAKHVGCSTKTVADVVRSYLRDNKVMRPPNLNALNGGIFPVEATVQKIADTKSQGVELAPFREMPSAYRCFGIALEGCPSINSQGNLVVIGPKSTVDEMCEAIRRLRSHHGR